MLRYSPSKIEKKWRQKWLAEKTYEPDLKRARKPFYNLMMFPYPSAEGLHIGGMRTFTGVDIYGRMKRMQGYDVFEPIGLDAFGIHSENYALKTGRHPVAQARILEKNYYRQLGMMGNGFAWRERLETNDPAYYRWTQWIFTEMFRRGLAYRKRQPVNWCPSCKTVLADEQVIAGTCERCGSVVIKKELEQWFFRITRYADRLLDNLENLDWSERVKLAQKNWIGRSEGAEIEFRIKDQTSRVSVFTTRPDTLFGATFLVISPELAKKWVDAGWPLSQEVHRYLGSSLVKKDQERIAEGREKTGVATGIRAINPANGEEIPVWVADYVLDQIGTGAVMAVPAHDQRDFQFAKKFGLAIRIVICPHYPEMTCPVLAEAYTGEGHLVDSGEFDGMSSAEARAKITSRVGGKTTVRYHLRDWLISRQRYWGPPIPMIWCDACRARGKGERSDMPGWYAVPAKDLPVKLPFIKNFRPTGKDQSPLAEVSKFYKVRCPGCASWARRETDVSDTFLDSAWYFLRYPSAKNTTAAWDPATTKKWLPVDVYIGGAEHSVLHLLYARFVTMAFHEWGFLEFDEPFTRFRAHGLIVKDGAKMSKSKGNVVNPDEYIAAYGADALRMYLAFLAPFEQDGDFRDEAITGITRLLERVWKFAGTKRKSRVKNETITSAVHRAIKKVGQDSENLQYHTAISALMVLMNEFEAFPDAVGAEQVGTFLKLLAPFAPHITEEIWQGMRRTGNRHFASIHREPWPEYDPRLAREKTFELIVQVNGKMRGRLTLPVGAGETEAVAAARDLGSVTPYLRAEPREVIFVPDRLVNFVI